MRVLFLTHNFPRHEGDHPGSFLLRLARALGDAGVEVVVLAPAAPGLAARERIEGIEVERVRGAEDEPIPDNKLVNLAAPGVERFFTGIVRTTEG